MCSSDLAVVRRPGSDIAPRRARRSGTAGVGPRSSRRDIPALPFCHAYLKGPRPLPPSYPQVLATLGDHLRKRRLDLGLLQREVAERLGTDHLTITNWELNRTTPALRFSPGIVGFLGYAPWADGASLGERLRRSAERRVGKECSVTCRSRWSPYH